MYSIEIRWYTMVYDLALDSAAHCSSTGIRSSMIYEFIQGWSPISSGQNSPISIHPILRPPRSTRPSIMSHLDFETMLAVWADETINSAPVTPLVRSTHTISTDSDLYVPRVASTALLWNRLVLARNLPHCPYQRIR